VHRLCLFLRLYRGKRHHRRRQKPTGWNNIERGKKTNGEKKTRMVENWEQ